MGITFGDHLIDSGYYDITPEQEREIEAREECNRRGIDPDGVCADGGVTAWMVVDQEIRTGAAVEQPDFIYFECPECGFDSVQKESFVGSTACPCCAGDSGHDVGMKERVARSTDKPEGHDARKGTPLRASSVSEERT